MLFNSFQNAYVTLIIGVILVIGRIVFTIGYAKGGPNGRMVGRGIELLATLAFVGLTIYSIIEMFDKDLD